MTAPTATPAMTPFSLAPVLTDRITNISSSVSTASSTKDCKAGPLGRVAPRVVVSPRKSNRSSRLASRAPAHWQTMYRGA